jgi:tight adherence protein C
MDMSLLVVLAVFLAVGLFAYAMLGFLFAEDRVVARRLKGLDDYQVAEAKEAAPLLKPFRQRVMSPAVDGIMGVVHAFAPKDLAERTDAKLASAGHPGSMNASSFIALRVGLAAVAVACGVIAFLLGIAALRWAIVVLPVLAIIGWAIPGLWLENRIEHRKTEIRRTLPDMLDMLTISVQAGLGFDAAVAKYVKNSRGPLAMEFGRALQEVQAGVARRDALRRLADRCDVPELSSFITAMVQAEMLGTSVSQVLTAQASEMRLRRRQHAEQQAQKLPVKQVFPLVICILPATMIVILGPAVISIGQMLLGM